LLHFASKDQRMDLQVDDFYAMHVEFMVWLKEFKGKCYEDISISKLKSLFEEFCDSWNANHLKGKKIFFALRLNFFSKENFIMEKFDALLLIITFELNLYGNLNKIYLKMNYFI
jgi:hypothetical protein